MFRGCWYLHTKLNIWPAHNDSFSHLVLRSHAKKETRGANYSFTAGWSETNLIIIIVKKAQRKPAAFLRFHHNPIERLLAFVMIYKVTSQTDLLWQPERDQHEHYYRSCDQTSSPSPTPLSSATSPLPSHLFQRTAKNEAGSIEAGNKPIQFPPLLNTSPLQTRGKSSALWKLVI